MKIAVLVKSVPDTASVFKLGDDGRSVDLRNLKFVMSPYDEHAVEEAVKLKETLGADVVLVSLGQPEARDIIRSGLAMGADSGILVLPNPGADLSPRAVAHALAAVLRQVGADLVLAGKQAVDDDASQVPERVAELLGLPHVSVVTRLEIGGGSAVVDREIEGGTLTYQAPLPALFTLQKGINTPRYPTLPNIMKAKKKEIREIPIADLGLDADRLAPRVAVESVALPRTQRLTRILEGDLEQQVAELAVILREKEKVL